MPFNDLRKVLGTIDVRLRERPCPSVPVNADCSTCLLYWLLCPLERVSSGSGTSSQYVVAIKLHAVPFACVSSLQIYGYLSTTDTRQRPVYESFLHCKASTLKALHQTLFLLLRTQLSTDVSLVVMCSP